MVTPRLILRGTEAAARLYIPTSSGFQFLHILISACGYLDFLILAILVYLKRHLTVVLISISLMTSDTKHLLMGLLPFVYLPWRNVYSDPLLIS